MANIQNYLEYVNSCIDEDPTEFINECEMRYRNIITNIAQRIVDDPELDIVLLAGPSCSGKTTTSRLLSDRLDMMGRSAYAVSLDDFYRNREDAVIGEDGKPDYECLEALDLDLLSSTLNALITDRSAKLPVFDFKAGKRNDNAWEIKLAKNDVVVVEGLHALNPAIRGALPNGKVLSLYVNVSSRIYDKNMNIILNKRNIRFIRRVIRDYLHRGSSVENTYDMWKSVTEGEIKYLFPYRDNADLKINSIHLYEISVYKTTILKLLKDIDEASPFYSQAQKMMKSISLFKPMPVQAVPNNSLLNEFIFKNDLKS